MNIKTLLLGSVAAAGLATGAHAADLAKGVMTSLDVCDALGLSGLTISSDTDCLQLSGSISYMFAWGDYEVGTGSHNSGLHVVQTPDDYFSIPIAGDANSTTGRANDWDSQVIAFFNIVASADSDFGQAKAVIHIKSEKYLHSANNYGYYDGDDTGGSSTNTGGTSGTIAAGAAPSGTVQFDKAYVSVGDSTVLTAGNAGSIANVGDDTPLDWLGLFNSANVGTGVLWSVNSTVGGTTFEGGAGANIQTGGQSIQVTSSLGNGVTIGGGLEDIGDGNLNRAGTAVGFISYAGDNLTAHLTVLEAGVLDGHPDGTAYHAGFTGTFDKFKIGAAIAGDSSGYWDGLATAQATFDMFKLAGSVEATHDADSTNGGDGYNGFGASASATMTVSDGVSINVGGRYFDGNTGTANNGNRGYQGAIALIAAVTETLTLEGDIGVYGTTNGSYNVGGASSSAISGVPNWQQVYYGAASVTWAPGGGFTSSLKGEAYSDGAYKATFNAAKTFQ